jgi:2-C-methyl-D-erythritol 4-phosphate cytidylyltransferase/2-C-methyl-D-erythritol 2,4-cyclodiphosphate synthase
MYAVILVAAGRGVRLGAGTPKAFVPVRGRPLLSHALEQISSLKLAELVVVVPADYIEQTRRLIADFDFGAARLAVTPGGDSRQDSVAAGLNLVTASTVLVHDAARSFAPADLFEAGAHEISQGAAAAVPLLALSDTIKMVEDGWITGTLDRDLVGLAQTPQAFETDLLRASHLQVTGEFTDDAALLQSLGLRVRGFAGSPQAFKVTTPADLRRAEAELAYAAAAAESVDTPARVNLEIEPEVNEQVFITDQPAAAELAATPTRVGVGVDAHRFSTDSSRPMALGLLSWPALPILDGHSDGDAVAHALVDAMLSAAGLGDIGKQFGVGKSEYRDASGERFLLETLALIEAAGFELISASVEIVGDRPKIADRRDEMQSALAELLQAPIAVAATTTDGLGFLADSRGVGAVATALLRARG